jgi:hypothetical protein
MPIALARRDSAVRVRFLARVVFPGKGAFGRRVAAVHAAEWTDDNLANPGVVKVIARRFQAPPRVEREEREPATRC